MINILDNVTYDQGMEESFVASLLPDWESYRNEAFKLSSDFETEMSPRVLFDEPPLLNCEKESKLWLNDLMHSLWLERYNVKKLVQDASDCAIAADTAYTRLKEELITCEDTKNIELLRPYRDLLVKFLNACAALSKTVEQFPSEVKVI